MAPGGRREKIFSRGHEKFFASVAGGVRNAHGPLSRAME
jgi:hypothetical protein